MQNHHLTSGLLFLLLVGCAPDDPTPAQEAPLTSAAQALAAEPAPRARATELGRAAPPESGGAVVAPRTLRGTEVAAVNTPAAPPARRGFATPQAAASAGLPLLAELVESDHPSKRGFATAAEARSTALGNGIPVHFVRLDQLVAHRPGQDVRALLTDKQEQFFPILASGQVRSSMRVLKRADGTWEAAQFGSLEVVKASYPILQRLSAPGAAAPGSISLVEIPTVGALLLAYVERGALLVTPVFDVPGSSYVAGTAIPAAEAFATLAELAAKVDPSVPN